MYIAYYNHNKYVWDLITGFLRNICPSCATISFSTNTIIHTVSELGTLFIIIQEFRAMCVCSSVLGISPSVALREHIQIAVTIRYKSKSIYTGLQGEN